MEDVAALYRRYAPRLGRYFLAMTGDAARAEDLTQETFLRALRGIGGFRGESSPYTWLYAIAARVLQESIRRERRRSPLPSPAGETPEERCWPGSGRPAVPGAGRLGGTGPTGRRPADMERVKLCQDWGRAGDPGGHGPGDLHRAKLALAKALEEGER